DQSRLSGSGGGDDAGHHPPRTLSLPLAFGREGLSPPESRISPASRAGGRTALRPSPPGKEPVASGPLRPDLPPLRAYPPPEAENGSPPLPLRRLRRPPCASGAEMRDGQKGWTLQRISRLLSDCPGRQWKL